MMLLMMVMLLLMMLLMMMMLEVRIGMQSVSSDTTGGDEG